MKRVRRDPEPLVAWVYDQARVYRSLDTEKGDWLAALLRHIADALPPEASASEVRIDVGCGPDVYEWDGGDEEADPCLWN